MRVFSIAYHDVVSAGDYEASGFCGDDPAADPSGIYKLDAEVFRNHLIAITEAVDVSTVQRTAVATELDDVRGDLALLHFDDGGASAVNIGDMLATFGWRGHFWITTDRIGTPGFVTEADIQSMHAAGHVVGSHSCSHPMRMGSLSDEELAREWSHSLARLTDICKTPITTASVPGGDCTRRVAAAAAAAGVTTLFNSEPTSHPAYEGGCMVLGRYSVKRSTPVGEASAMAVGRLLPRYRQFATWNAKKLVKRVGGRYWLAVRRRVLA